MKRTKTLSFKLSLLFIGGMAFAMAAGGITTYFVQSNIVNNYTNTRLKNSIYEFVSSTDDAFIRAEATVEHGKRIAENYFKNKDQLYQEAYVEDSLLSISKLYDSPTHQLEDICAHYIVLNPAYTHCTIESETGDGLFHVMNDACVFENRPVTNVLKYSETDTEHVGWWYPAAKSKDPLWIEPYFNGNIGKNLFSYVSPFFAENGEFLGVVGIDVDLNLVIKNLNNNKEYNDAYSVLLNKDGTIVYHKDVETFIDGRYYPSNKKVSDIAGIENFNESEDGAITYRYGGHRRTTMSVSLSNGLVYGLSVRTGELRRPTRLLTFAPLLAYATMTVILVFVFYFLIKHHIKPLQELHEGVENVKKGNWKFNIKPKHDDEIGELTKSFSDMITSLSEKNRMISAMAFIDGLTGVKNKNAHREMVERIDREIKEGKAKFAVVMLDVDKLKMINDNFGHDNGDKAIIGSCYSLCKAFSHSPVFRIGGDEFVAIVEGEDYEKRREIFEKLRNNEIKVREEKYDYSTGMATYEPANDRSFNDVFSRADQEMYLDKKAKRKYE